MLSVKQITRKLISIVKKSKIQACTEQSHKLTSDRVVDGKRLVSCVCGEFTDWHYDAILSTTT